FLRGSDYVRRRAVENVVIEDITARAQVRGAEAEYAVMLRADPSSPSGLTSECSCPAFSKINGHCKHVGALLIALRDQARGPRESSPHGGGHPRSGGEGQNGYGQGNHPHGPANASSSHGHPGRMPGHDGERDGGGMGVGNVGGASLGSGGGGGGRRK